MRHVGRPVTGSGGLTNWRPQLASCEREPPIGKPGKMQSGRSRQQLLYTPRECMLPSPNMCARPTMRTCITQWKSVTCRVRDGVQEADNLRSEAMPVSDVGWMGWGPGAPEFRCLRSVKGLFRCDVCQPATPRSLAWPHEGRHR